ncbi:MAG: ABC transporter substrate-binding protein [Alphaproteobacteria bacterium]|nr:ABC transporter substrate-binding protein [Alphaproteobacteria bacterium]
MLRLISAAICAAWLLIGGGALAQSAGSAPGRLLTVAMPIDPQTIDPTTNTANVAAIIMQNVFETLYAYDAEWRLAPMLATTLPVYTDGGRTMTVPLRAGVRFHNGATMTSADVVASIERWMKLSIRGRLAAESIETVTASGPLEVQLKLKAPNALIANMFAFFNAAMVVMPEATAKATMGGPLTNAADFIGTGPFRFVERRPDQYVRLTKFEEYVPSDRTFSGYTGKREAMVQELRFIPVPNAGTRLQSVLSGQYDVADNVPTEFVERIRRTPSTGALVVKWSGWIQMIMNNRQGPTQDMRVRQAVQAVLDPEAIMTAAFGTNEFFGLSGSLYPQGAPLHTTAGVERYAQKNVARAKELLAQAGYAGQPFRIITSQQYDFIYKAALVAADSMRAAGINVEIVLMDWASVLERRNNPAIWEAFFTFHNFVPDPALITFMNPSFPGWWDTPAKREALGAFTGTLDDAQRVAAWHKLHGVMMEEVPQVTVGSYYGLMAFNQRVKGLQPFLQTPYFNVSNGTR